MRTLSLDLDPTLIHCDLILILPLVTSTETPYLQIRSHYDVLMDINFLGDIIQLIIDGYCLWNLRSILIKCYQHLVLNFIKYFWLSLM